MRTLIVSDAHGYPQLVQNAIDAAGDYDQLVFAGDAVDIGPDPRGVLSLLRELDAVCLMGNHDAAALLCQRISPQDYVSFGVADEARTWMESWRITYLVDGVLISHAGVIYPGTDFTDRTLNSLAHDMNGPLWYRPEQLDGGIDPFMPPRQIVGHTPAGYYDSRRIAELEEKGLYMIDPYARQYDDGSLTHYRYAIIEDGHVAIHHGQSDA